MRYVKNKGTTTRKKIATRLKITMMMARMILRFDKLTCLFAAWQCAPARLFHHGLAAGEAARGSTIWVASNIATRAVMTAHKVVTAR